MRETRVSVEGRRVRLANAVVASGGMYCDRLRTTFDEEWREAIAAGASVQCVFARDGKAIKCGCTEGSLVSIPPEVMEARGHIALSFYLTSEGELINSALLEDAIYVEAGGQTAGEMPSNPDVPDTDWVFSAPEDIDALF